jgi:hypothetical protein
LSHITWVASRLRLVQRMKPPVRPAMALLGLGLVLTACASAPPPAASPAFTLAAECERDGGRWHADKNVCEYQSPGPIR